MKSLKVQLNDVNNLGYQNAFILSYLKAKPNTTRREMEIALNMSQTGVAQAIIRLERLGYIKQICSKNSRQRKIMIGVEILK